MSCTAFRSIIDSSERLGRHTYSNIAKRRKVGGGIEVKSDAHEIPINVTTQKNINALLADG